MHNNYYFLRQVSARLREKLKGFTLVSCFSQNKDELVFEFNDAKRSFFIRADLQGDFSCLTFPGKFNRARKNSIDLFEETIMKSVVDVKQYSNERSFAIVLTDQLSIVFKMHGNKANVVLLKNDEEVDRFKNNIPGGAAADRNIDWSREEFARNSQHPERLYFTFGSLVWNYIGDKSWENIQKTRQQLEDPAYYIVQTEKKIALSLLPVGKIIEEFRDPIIAVNAFYNTYVSITAFIKEKNAAIGSLKTHIASTTSWIEKTSGKLQELKSDDHYKAWGDLLMANLNAIEAGTKSIELDDFYHPGKKISIKLDPTLSPQKNAERYYRKGKNQQIEIGKLTEGLTRKAKQLSELQSDLKKIEEADDLKTLREKYTPLVQQSTAPSVPYREFGFKGFRIWVGKDAKTNDELTLKYSFKDDLWLHVRDGSGSHVLLKHQANKPFPKDVIEYAAGIAAFNSKRRTEALVPVIVTQKKFVRKRKGDPPGAVVVEREEVILTEPKNPLT